MEAIFVQEGNVLDYTAVAALSCGDVLQYYDGRAAVALHDAAIGDKIGVKVGGVVDFTAGAALTFTAGDPVYWDVSADTAIAESSATGEDIYLGRAILAKVATTETLVRVNLNADPPVASAVRQSRVVEFDCEAGTLNEAVTLIPAAWNKTGLVILGVYGRISEQMAGSSEDQGIVTIADTAASPNTIGALTPSDGAADDIGDAILGTGGLVGVATGVATATVAANLGVTGEITQKTSGGSPAGKIKVRVLFAPLT